MFKKLVIPFSIGLTVTAGTAMLAAPGQGVARPGQATEGRVWIENRGRNEAVPVTVLDAVPVVVQNVSPTVTMPVRLAGPAPGVPPPPVAIQAARQQWDYQLLSVPGDVTAQQLTTMLVAPGNNMWELTGVQIPAGGATLVVMKRPR